MASKKDLTVWVSESLHRLGGSGDLVQIAEDIWRHHEQDLRSSGNLFYTWQYDMRWSANELRRSGMLRPVAQSPSGVWQLANESPF